MEQQFDASPAAFSLSESVLLSQHGIMGKSACVLWGHIPAAEYRKVIVGLIFLRYISSAFEKRYVTIQEHRACFYELQATFRWDS